MDSIPILKIGNALLVTIQVDMHDRLATQLQEDLTTKIVQHRTRGVLIDISALEIVDSFIGRMLANIASVSRLLDADTVVVGMRPEVAITLVELGLGLPGVKTALNAERGLALIGGVGGDEQRLEFEGELMGVGCCGVELVEFGGPLNVEAFDLQGAQFL